MNISNESIQDQLSSRLGPLLEKELLRLRSMEQVSRVSFALASFSEVVFDETGVKTFFNLGKNYDLYTTVPGLNDNNVLFNRLTNLFNNNDSSKLIRANDIFAGTINLKRGRVSGDFSKVESNISLGENFLRKGSTFSIAEVAALILHEIGHIMTSMEMVSRSMRANYIMLAVTQQVTNGQTEVQRLGLLEDLEDTLDVKISGKEKAARKELTKDFYKTLILDGAVSESQHALGHNIYDSRSFEALSDEYVVKMGYGKQLSTGLDKLYRLSGSSAYRSVYLNTALNAIKVMVGIFGTINLVMLPAILVVVGGNPLFVTYDDPKKRMEKIQQGLTNKLKDRSMDKALREQLTDDIKTLKGLTKDMNSSPGAWEFVYKTFLFKGRREQKGIDLQHRLEEMANNDMFVTAANV